MPIYDQTFRRYAGERRTHMLWWVVARNTLRPFFKAKLLSRLLFGAGIGAPVIIASIGLFLAAKFADLATDKNIPIERAVEGADFPVFGYNLNLNSMLFLLLDMTSNVFWLLIAIYGAGSISQDRKYFALPLYFSRPLTVLDYMIGKIAGLSMYPIIVLFLATVVVFVQAWAYFFTPAEGMGHIRTLVGATIWIVVNGVMLALSMAAFSSVTKSAAAATVMYVGFWFASVPIANIIAEFSKSAQFGAVSLSHSLNVLAIHLIQPQARWLRGNPNNSDFGLLPALASIVFFAGIFLWVTRRNLKVVEVVK